MSACLRWLHLSDLHLGQDLISWHAIRPALKRDLKNVRDWAEGPFDLVLISGGLTQDGSAEQFEKATVVLGNLWTDLMEIQEQAPLLLTVPGNHDANFNSRHYQTVAAALKGWHGLDADFLKEFWTPENSSSQSRRELTRWFKRFTEWQSAWHSRYPLAPHVEIKQGLLPGDFAAVLTRGDARFGVLGLNSGFLHLREPAGSPQSPYKGRLHLALEQLDACCDGDGPRWCEENQVNFLLTHHAPDWLCQQVGESLPRAYADIYEPQRFVAHLFGKQYAGRHEMIVGERRFLQSLPLFEAAWEAPERERGTPRDRKSGYLAGRIDVHAEQISLKLWPRQMVQSPVRAYQVDSGWSLNSDEQRAHIASLLRRSRRPPVPAALVLPPLDSDAEAVVGLLAQLLEDTGEAGLRVALSHLRFPDAPPEAEVLARVLLAGRDLPSCGEALRLCIQRGGLSEGVAAQALAFAAPYLWVPSAAARRLAQRHSAVDPRHVAVNGKLAGFTPQMYLRRAVHDGLNIRVPKVGRIPRPKREGTHLEYYRDQLVHNLCPRMGIDEPDMQTPDELRRQLEAHAREGRSPVYAVFDWPPPEEILQALQAEFPRVRFFLLTGLVPTESVWQGRLDIEVLQPLLKPDEERLAFDGLCSARRQIESGTRRTTPGTTDRMESTEP